MLLRMVGKLSKRFGDAVGSRSVSEPEKEFHDRREPWRLLPDGRALAVDVLARA
jgi:hypothetical protein